QCTTSSKRHQAQADGFNYAEWADHIEQKISQQKLRKYLTSSTRFEHYDEDDDYVAKSYINLSVHRKNLKYFKETDLEKAHPSTIHTNLARHRLKDVHEKTTIVNNMLLRRELWSLSWKPHETFEAKVDWILERITKQDPEYCSLIGVIKSVEIGWSFMALHGHQGRSKGLDPSHYLQQLVRIRCESSASVTADVESAYLVANEAPSIWHARLGYPPPAPTQAILKVTHGGPSKLPSPDSCDGCVSLRALYPPAIRFVQQFVHCSETADVHTYLPVARPPPREQLMVDTPPAKSRHTQLGERSTATAENFTNTAAAVPTLAPANDDHLTEEPDYNPSDLPPLEDDDALAAFDFCGAVHGITTRSHPASGRR
ncbi:hypothetical protein DYB28_002544, partial [Aphanomyces astaci]